MKATNYGYHTSMSLGLLLKAGGKAQLISEKLKLLRVKIKIWQTFLNSGQDTKIVMDIDWAGLLTGNRQSKIPQYVNVC